MVDIDGGRRVSRASFNWFQQETATTLDGGHGLISQDGKLRDEYIVKRQSVNKPATLKTIPMLADLTTDITMVDGWVFTQLFLSGFAKMSTKVDELNKINVFPIADGDTGANMKVSLKLPTRNLLLDPSDSVLTVSSNLAADVLLNGQGNSGTILSHFFVSLAEEIKVSFSKDALTIAEFAACLIATSAKMNDAVSDPVEGTLLSVSRDACLGLKEEGPFMTLKDLLKAWAERANTELAKTPDQLVVDGVKVLEKAGVVDSGAQGFAYIIEGMFLASKGKLPEAMDPSLFKTTVIATEDAGLKIDHKVIDSKYRFCTEAVIVTKEGMDQKSVLESVTAAANNGLGDSIASVSAPAKEGGDVIKIHIHTNEPENVFEQLRAFSRSPLLKKEKVEDMLSMRELMHGDTRGDLSEAKFTIVGLCSMVLPPSEHSDDLFTLPAFMVPSTTQEPIDIRFSTDSDTCNALNMQRHENTAIRYTTAAPNPMQIKIELLAALAKGKPVLLFLMSKDKRVSALGRNVIAAVDMLSAEQKASISVFVHGWGFFESIFLLEAISCADEGKTIDEAIAACRELADRNFVFASLVSSATVRKLLTWRPGLFAEDFTVEDNEFIAFGIPPTIREGDPLTEAQRLGVLTKVQGRAPSLLELQDAEVKRIKNALKPGQKISSLLVPCVGRLDFGYVFVEKLKAADVSAPRELTFTPRY